MRPLPKPTWRREPDCLSSVRLQLLRLRWMRTLRAAGVILVVALASGYLGARIDPIGAWMGRTWSGLARSAPGLVAALDPVSEAAAQPLVVIEIPEREVVPAWSSRLAPQADGPSNAGAARPPALADAAMPLQLAAGKPPIAPPATPSAAKPAPEGPQTLAVEQCWSDAAQLGPKERAAATIRASFIVVGSYTDPMNALRTYSRVEDRWRATIVHTEVSGRLYRRVLVGPFDRAAAKAVRLALAERGLKKTWALAATCRPAS